MQYHAWRLATFVLGRLPLTLAYRFAAAAGWLAFALWPRGRRATIRNFRHVLPGAPEADVRRVARASLQNYCRYLVDFIRFQPGPDGGQRALGVEAGPALEALARVRSEGRGVIIAPMHFGNWDAGASAAAIAGHPLTVVVDTFADARLNALVVGARERLGLKVVAVEKAGPSLVRALRKAEVVALLIDKPTPGQGVTVSFFGAPVEVPRGPAHLALRTGAALVPCAAPRLQRGKFAFEVLADFSIDTTPTGDHEADVRRLTQALMSAHERYIRCYPDQWYMFREMWPRPGRGTTP